VLNGVTSSQKTKEATEGRGGGGILSSSSLSATQNINLKFNSAEK